MEDALPITTSGGIPAGGRFCACRIRSGRGGRRDLADHIEVLRNPLTVGAERVARFSDL